MVKKSSCDHLAMVMEKGQPPRGLLLVCSTFQSRQVARDGWLGDLEAECQQLAVDPRRTPPRIIGLHSADEYPDLVMDCGPPEWPGAQTPEPPETGAVPRDHGLGFYDDQGTSPAGPPLPERNPKEPVDVAQ